METQIDIAQGYSKRPKEEVQAFWEEVACALNALGPPSKEPAAWRKVWVDWKCYIKRNLSANKREMVSTGGGQCNLQRINSTEEQVIRLTGLQTCPSGISGASDFGGSVEFIHCGETAAMDISADMDIRPSGSGGRKEKESTNSLLKEQIKMQKQFYESVKEYNEATTIKMNEMSTYMRRMNRSLERLADTAEKQQAEQQRHNEDVKELQRQKIELKLKMWKLEHPNQDLDSD